MDVSGYTRSDFKLFFLCFSSTKAPDNATRKVSVGEPKHNTEPIDVDMMEEIPRKSGKFWSRVHKFPGILIHYENGNILLITLLPHY